MPELRELMLNIDGMHCASCVRSIEQALLSLPGVSDCQVNLATGSALISFDESQLAETRIVGTIKQLGYSAETGQLDILSVNRSAEVTARRSFVTSLYGTVPLAVIAMWPMFAGGPVHSLLVDGLTQAVLAGLVLFYSGRGILSDAAVQLRRFRANMNTLVALGTLAAFGWSLFGLYRIYTGGSEKLYFESAAMIVTLILLGRMLEARTRRKAGTAIEELLKLQPSVSTAIINGVEVETDPAAARPGMIFLVRPGERVPADGSVIEGDPVLDESMLTGESLPVEKKKGGGVIGGSLNGNIPFKMQVTAFREEGFLASVIRLVSEAQSRKAPVQKLADRVAGVFVPVVIGAASVTWLIWFLIAPESPHLLRSVVAVLIIACPCALGLATPTAVLAGTGRGTREGIIIKGGDVLEAGASVDTVIFDKTGTLTKGVLEVSAVKTFGRTPEQNLVRMIGSIESQSEHPVGQAIARYMKSRQISPAVVKRIEAHPGFGMLAECDGRELVVGNRALMEQENVSFGPSLLQGEREMEKGRTVVFAAMDGHVVGIVSLADQIRGDAKDLIKALQGQMQQLTMISGDSYKTTAGVARLLGVEHFEAEIRPAQKQLIVESYRRVGSKVAMIGDGINDAPALAAADVGVAIGSGTDVAIEAADVVLVRSEPAAVLRMFNLSRQTMKVIRQNLFWAFFYNIVAIPIAAGLFYPLIGLTLSPMIAALAMSFSSVLVVTNSLRLNHIEL